jgi:WD40 repeat protein/predicted Ser/Thr protein kinase
MLEGALKLGNQVAEPAPHPAWGHPLPSDGRGAGGEGTRFGDYELLDEIARGGMGVVYRARQLSLDRTVAVKLILTGHFADTAAVRRFKAEATAAAKLRHPNIVAIHEIGEEAGQHFFSMDYVEGPDLAEFMRQQPVSLRHAARLLKTIAEAIHHAHGQGIIHRDLKPSNILIDGLFEPRITDFGLAKDLKADSDLTLTGQLLGSPNYIAPEQASGKGHVGVPADLYSLGAILYHLLSGRPPFAAETVASTLQQVANEEPVSPRRLNPSVPRDLETICLKCLEKEPAKRYPTAAALAEELNRFLSDEPIHARPTSAPARVWRWCRRKPVVAGLTAAVVVSVGLGFLGVLWQWRQSEAHRRLAEQKSHESRRNLYAADMLLAQGALEAGNIGRARELLGNYLPREGEEDLRGWEWRYAWGQCRTDELFTLEAHEFTVSALALSTNGARLASGGHDGRVILWNLKEKQIVRSWKTNESVQGLAFSGDEKELIVGTTDGRVTFWNCETWQPVATLTNLSRVRSLTVSPDGKLLAVFGLRWLTLWRFQDRQRLARLPLLAASEFIPGGVTFSPDSSLLAYGRGDGAIALWDIATRTNQVPDLEGHERYVTALAFSADGSTLVSGSRDRTVRIWDVASRQMRRQLSGFSAFVIGLALSPDGSHLAVTGADQRVRLFETQSWEEINVLKGHSDAVWPVVFARDGRTMLTGSKDGTVKCWAVSKNEHPVSQGLPADCYAAVLLPGGKALHLGHPNRTNSYWRTDPLQELARYHFPLPYFGNMFSPDGKLWVAAGTNDVVKVFDCVNQRFLRDLSMPAASPTDRVRFAFSLDSRMLAGWGNDYTCRVWRITAKGDAMPVASQVATFAMRTQTVWSLRFSDSGRLLAIGYEGGIADLWSMPSGQKQATLIGENWAVMDVAISRNESWAVTASGSGRVHLWNLESGRVLATLSGELGSSQAVAFSPDETRLAACGGDGTVRIWDLESKQEVATLKLHHERLDRLAFSAEDDSLIVVANAAHGRSRLFVLRAPKVPDP